jgi:hypothetical protein
VSKAEERLAGAVFSNLTIKGCGCPISDEGGFRIFHRFRENLQQQHSDGRGLSFAMSLVDSHDLIDSDPDLIQVRRSCDFE